MAYYWNDEHNYSSFGVSSFLKLNFYIYVHSDVGNHFGWYVIQVVTLDKLT